MRRDLLMVCFLVLCAWTLHCHGLAVGFWLDDHTHLEICRENGFANLQDGNRFDWNGKITHVWWAKEETRWAYFRPLTVSIRVALMRLFGLDPLPFHVVHLTLFSLSVALLYALLRRCGWGLVSAGTASLLFVLHPANCLTTPWLANDGPVLVGLWLVAGLWLFHVSAQAGHLRIAPLAGVFVCYGLAMASRENGIMVGPLLLLFDLAGALGPKAPDVARSTAPRATWSMRCAIGMVLALEGLSYLALRTWCMGDAPLPRSPYFHWPTEPGFLSWWAYKLLNELLCLPLGLPFVPIVDVPWWQTRPVCAAVALLALAALAITIVLPLRRCAKMWALLCGIVLAQAPTALAFSASYNYYLATVGWAILLTMWARQLWPARPRLVAGTAVVLGAWYLAGLWGGSWIIHAGAIAEHKVHADVLASRPEEYPPGTRLFFVNMPFLSAEVAPALRNTLDRPDLEVYPLTFAANLFLPGAVAAIEQEDEYTLLLRAGAHAFFSGQFGDHVQMAWYGAHRHELSQGPVTLHPQAGPMPFRVEVVEMDAQGVWALRFVFEKPLRDPGYRFFVGSPDALAQRLCFHGNGAGSKLSPTLEKLPPDPPLMVRDMDRLRRVQTGSARGFSLLESLP